MKIEDENNRAFNERIKNHLDMIEADWKAIEFGAWILENAVFATDQGFWLYDSNYYTTEELYRIFKLNA